MGVALYAIVGGIVLGWLSTRLTSAGARVAKQVGIEHLWVVPASLSVQIAWAKWWSGTPALPAWVRAVVPLAIVALLLMVVANREWPGARLAALGIALNLAVIVANGGLMPVSLPDASASLGTTVTHPLREGQPVPGSKDIVVDPNRMRLGFLSDHLTFRLPYGPLRVVSPGDVLMMAGLAWWIAHFTRLSLSSHKGSTWLRTSEPDGSSSSPAITA